LGKLNILFVIPQLEKGGSETLVYNIASLLDRKLFNVSLAYFQYYGNEKFRSVFQEQSIRLHHIPRNRSADYSAMRIMERIVRENNIHIVNAHHFVSMVYSFYACKIAHRRRLVYTEHSSWEVEKVPLKWRVMGRLLLRQLDCVMGISDDVTQTLKTIFHLRDKNTLTIRNGVDIDNKGGMRDARSIRNEFGLAENMKVIAMVANFRKVKNHLMLLRGFRELLNDIENVKLLLIGQGTVDDLENSEDDVRSYLEEYNLHDKVILTGHRNDVNALLSIADVFCLTSFKEGLPISMLEAMSSGLPLVGTNVQGIRDVVMNGKNGFIVELCDHLALKDSLLKILTNNQLRRSFGHVSRRIVLDSYSINNCAHQYQNLFLRLITN
jgi:glycosyltransferase involved in cell wall biosynthesis